MIKFKETMVRCFFSSYTHRHRNECHDCRLRFVCLTNKWTEEDRLAYKEIPAFLCNVTNDEEGNKFYKQLKKQLNTERYKLIRYGRAKNRKEKGGNRSFTPLHNCDYFGVYLKDSKLIQFQRQRRWEDGKA